VLVPFVRALVLVKTGRGTAAPVFACVTIVIGTARYACVKSTSAEEE
jgi:hypothetical protein